MSAPDVLQHFHSELTVLAHSRNPFTSDERQLVAEFLAKRLSDDRSAPSVYKEFVRKVRLPGLHHAERTS